MLNPSLVASGKRIDPRAGKSPRDSMAEMTIVMMPTDANLQGNVFGGTILNHVDLIAGLVAKRHAAYANVVTASIDRMIFVKPVYIGNALILTARLNYVGRSSMEVEETVEAEDLDSGNRVTTGTAFVTMVALDKRGKPVQVPPLVVESADDRKRFEEGKSRMKARLEAAGRT